MTAIVDFATARSRYAEALVMTAIEENIVLVVPGAALTRAAALIPAGHELGLDVLLGLPCTVVEALDATQARAVAALLGPGTARSARDRSMSGWITVLLPGLTGDASTYST